MLELLESRIAPATFIVTSLADAGSGSLRDAIAEANDHPGADVVVFKKGVTGTIEITSGQIPISDTLTIKGPGSTKLTLDANLQSRIFSVTDFDPGTDSPLAVSGLTFFRGKQPDTDSSGGAIASFESLKVKDCFFWRNEVRPLGGSNFIGGGAIFTQLTPNGVPTNLDIRNSSFVFNFCDNVGGAIHAQVTGSVVLQNNRFTDNASNRGNGGAINAEAGPGKTLRVEDCQFLGNHAGRGGAASLSTSGFGDGDTTIIVRGSLFTDNHTSGVAGGDGGGLVIDGGKTIVERSAFIQNTAADQGGGLSAQFYTSLVIRSSQFLGNESRSSGLDHGGGGLRLEMANEASVTRIIASIISSNSATAGGGILVNADDDGAGNLEIVGSNIAGNHAIGNGGGILVLENSANQSADVKVTRSKITDNVAETGSAGGLEAVGDGKFMMQSCQVTRNHAASLGGGVLLDKTTPSTIIGSMIAQNSANIEGGGIFSASPLELRTTKILGNTAGIKGGGISSSDSLSLNFCTVSGNIVVDFGGGIFSTERVSLSGSKVVGNFSLDGRQIVEG